MKSLQRAGTILATMFSIIFALVQFPESLVSYGIFKATLFTVMGIAAIWAAYFILGILLRYIYEQGLREHTFGRHHVD